MKDLDIWYYFKSLLNNLGKGNLKINEGVKVFYLDEKVSLLLNKTKNKIYERNLPFKEIFLCCVIRDLENDVILPGLLLHQQPKSKIFCTLVITFKDGKNSLLNIPLFDKIIQSELNKLSKNKINKSIIKQIQTLMCNFIDFLNNPEVKTIISKTPKEQNEKRKRRGKQPLPTQAFIRLDGKLKQYISNFNSEEHAKYSHRFWVRGHFRTLNHERYGNNIGKKKWILPFVKGKGILINKNYEVIK